MSRGLGVVQRALLSAVEETWTDLRPELWLCVTTVDLGLGEHRESRRRAAHGLASLELIELRKAEVLVWSAKARHGQAKRVMLFARLPMGTASQEYADELRAEYNQHQHAMWTSSNVGGPDYKRQWQWVKWYQASEWRSEHIHYLG